MEYHYSNLVYNERSLEFTFTIKGRNGNERKVVKFSRTDYFNAYNIALGTALENGKVDYNTITNSGDLLHLFSTVAYCAILFLEKNTDKNIFFTGDTEKKTKVYQEILRRHFEEFSEKCYIFGILENEYNITLEPFVADHKYSGFLIQNKLTSL